MTLKDLALALDYTAHGYISELESGKKSPTVDFALKVSRFFNVSLDALLKDEAEIVTGLSDNVNALVSRSSLLAKFPTSEEVEKLRLVLSTFQDESGQILRKSVSLPGWRDFERAVALVFNGVAQENKSIFDVVLTSPTEIGSLYGLSCKMRGTLRDADRTGRVTIELSNSASKFWRALSAQNIRQSNYKETPSEVGRTLVATIKQWHLDESHEQGGRIDLGESAYFTLSWSNAGEYQLFLFDLELPIENVLWSFPEGGLRLVGSDPYGKLYEWYGESGGQFKYYPRIDQALWLSTRFHLEPLPKRTTKLGLLAKTVSYFPQLWERAAHP